jgi:hypothetical protein
MTTMQQENEIAVENASLVETKQENASLTPTPPSKTDILLQLAELCKYFKQLQKDVHDYKVRASKKLSTELYITQLYMQALKIMLSAYKETTFNVTNNTNVDISNQVNELIKISRRIGECKQKPK